ncbi:MAG TPA: response regulator [Anaerolineales bacterium]|nr:response regulator [Anaerolineales bacterium]
MNKLALIIEDDEDLANIFAEALHGIGLEVENLTDGESARQRLAGGEVPFVILLDMHLPLVSGKDLLQEIKNDPRFSNTWLMITTADARLAEDFRDQVDFALIKPILFGQLRDLVKRLKPKDEI